MRIKHLALVLTVLVAVGSFFVGRASVDTSIDNETLGEIRAEAAMELYDAVDECGTDMCLEIFSRIAQKDVASK